MSIGATEVAPVSSEVILSVRGLEIMSSIGGQIRTIVSGLDFELASGETLGLVGESGSGKSMTARCLLGLLPPGLTASGEILYSGRNLVGLPRRPLAQVRGTEIGLIFQDPFTMLNPLMRCGRHIDEALTDERGRKLSRRSRRAEAIRRLAEVGIDDEGVVDAYPFQLSGGMRQRIGIAAALARNPKVLIADEPSTALDTTTQKEILALLKSLQASRSMALILITHDLRVAFSMCDRIIVLYAGSLLESGPAAAIEARPLHPYTLGLLLSEPPGDRRLSPLPSIAGNVPDPDVVSDCCAFSPRCRWSARQCIETKPPVLAITPSRRSACVRLHEIGSAMATERDLALESAPGQNRQTFAGPLLRIENLVKVFETTGRSSRRAVRALDDVSIEVLLGESVGLVGESGSGKSTLARCVVGLETPTSGSIAVGGLDASDYESISSGVRKELRRTVQIVFQDPYSSLNPALTIGTTLKEALGVGGARGDLSMQAGLLLERVGLASEYTRRKPVALSGGERQRVAIARALAVQPKMIVCDEPVSALDVSVQAQILNLLSSLRDEYGMSYLFITHDLAVVRQVVDRVYVLFRGRIVESGAVETVLNNPRDAYTRQLVDSVPRSDADWLRLHGAGGGGS